MAKTASELLRDGMIRHGLKAEDLLAHTGRIAAREAHQQVATFLQGGPISINVAQAVVEMIVMSKGDNNG